MTAVAAPSRSAPTSITSRSDRPCRLVDRKPFEQSGVLLGLEVDGQSRASRYSGVRTARWSAGTPSTPILGADGTLLHDDHGKMRYAAVVTFVTKEVRVHWNNALLSALAAAAIGGAP